MSLLILIHKTKAEDARNTSIRLFEQLIDRKSTRLNSSHRL